MDIVDELHGDILSPGSPAQNLRDKAALAIFLLRGERARLTALLVEKDTEITRLRDENVELKSQIVMECNEDKVPTFNQGLIEHELLEVVTAKRLDTLVALVVSLRARLAEAEAGWERGLR